MNQPQSIEHTRAQLELDSVQEWSDTGLLWYINTTALHPRGLALGVNDESGSVVLYSLDGSEPYAFSPEIPDAKFLAFERLITKMREVARGGE